MSNRSIGDVTRWYKQKARPFLEGMVEEEKLQSFDKDLDQLDQLDARANSDLNVCFLGNSGVGKSTLINAIVGGGKSVVPAGGVGPLTAQAIMVRYGAKCCFRVVYQSAGQILKLVFGLEQMFRQELGEVSQAAEDLPGVEELDETERVGENAADDAEGESSNEDGIARAGQREAFLHRARLLVTGSQDEVRDIRYLIDSLRSAAGGQRKWGTAPQEADEPRLEGLRQALAFAKRKEGFCRNAETDLDFDQSLRDHASGFLAPLIKKLELNWNHTILQDGIVFVDLPGVGVLQDVHKEVTREWIRKKANALVLITDHRGINESVAEALRQTEFLNSLLYSADEPEDDPIVLVAVTRVDDIAASEYQKNKSIRKAEHFEMAAEQIRGKLRSAMAQSLESVWLRKDEGDENFENRRKVIDNLLAKLQVHPLSAPEYIKIEADDEEDRPFLKSLEQTGIPGFRDSLAKLAAERKTKALTRLESQKALFLDMVTSTLKVIQSQWQSDQRSETEIRKLREELQVFMEPLRKELQTRQGAYRSFLRRTIPQRIEDLVDNASLAAQKSINRYLSSKLGTSHWSTLRASVRRGGKYSGASAINLPSEFALRFEEPIAEAWSKKILADIRTETKHYADDCVRLVGEVARWAEQQGARVQIAVVEAQRDAIRADAKKLESVGREMVKEMRDDAKAQIIQRIEPEIGIACSKFVRRNLDVGPGVKDRILRLYGEMADVVTAAAKAPATHILQQLFREVEKEIREAFGENSNPLDSIAEAIVASQESYLKRSDAQKRRRILEQVAAILDEPETQGRMAQERMAS